MRPYFERMDAFGKALKASQIQRSEANVKQIKAFEARLAEAVETVR